MKREPAAIEAQTGIVSQMATYIEAMQHLPLDPSAKEAAIKCIFDLISAAAVGLNDIGPIAIRKVASNVTGAGNTPIWLTGQRSSTIGAAWSNSSAAAALDLDDGNRYARGHPGAAIIPAAFAVAHEVGSTLEELLTAIVLGYEIGVVIGEGRTTYGSSGTWTPYGVVAAVAYLRKTPREIVAHALAIAGESAPNQAFAGGPAPRIPAPEGAAVKEGIPWSVVTGMTALYLAEAGHTGPRNILDSKRHYQFPDKLILGQGRISETYFKPYACCRHIHAPLAAMASLIAEHNIEPSSIEWMEVEIHAAGLRISNRPNPSNLIDVQYSIPYCLALVALYGSDSLIPVTNHYLGREEVVRLASNVRLTLSPELDAIYPKEILSRVTIASGGVQYVSAPTPPEGEPLMTWNELDNKFVTATRLSADKSEQSRIHEAIGALRRSDISALLACLSDIDLRK